MATEIRWIKITVDMFEDDKIDFILNNIPDPDAIIVVWVRLLALAGRCNAGGFVMLAENIPYTDEMLAPKFRKPLATIRMALETFERLGMIFRVDDGSIAITNWEKHQNVDGMDKIKEQSRARMARYRERLRIEGKAEGSPSEDSSNGNCNRTGDVTVTQSSYSNSNSISDSKNSNQEEFKELDNQEKPHTPKKPGKPKPTKHEYGTYKNVLLTDANIAKLKELHPNDYEGIIEHFSVKKEGRGYTYKNDYAAIQDWGIEAYFEKRKAKKNGSSTGFKPKQSPIEGDFHRSPPEMSEEQRQKANAEIEELKKEIVF